MSKSKIIALFVMLVGLSTIVFIARGFCDGQSAYEVGQLLDKFKIDISDESITSQTATMVDGDGPHYYVSPAGSDETGDGTPENPWRTIQYAVNHIYEEDATVHAAAGTYTECVIIQDIAAGIDLIGAGAEVTTIDASGIYKNGGVIHLPTGQGCVVSGFTITGGTYEGSGDAGGAIRGAGVDGWSESTTSAVVENCIIEDNFAYGYDYCSGGVSLGPNSIIRNNTFINNTTAYVAGAVFVGAGSIVEQNIFEDNHRDIGKGGAIESKDTSVIVRRNIFISNSCGSGSGGKGGAFYGKGTVYNNLFVRNSCNSYNKGYGGAAYVTGGTFINNTLVDNIGDIEGDCSGIYFDGSGVVVNNIIANGTNGVGLYIKEGSTVTADYNDIWNNDLGPYGGSAVLGDHDIHEDPLFVDATSSDYHLTADSPCRDAGDNNAPGLPETDMDGQPRIMDGIVDIGADEYPGQAEPTAGFSADPLSGPPPLTVTFTDESIGTIDSWEWDFGDGGTSTAQNPSYTYNTPGAYTVSLTVTGPGGTDTETKSDYITVNTKGWEGAYDTLFRHPSDLTLLRQYRDESLNKTKKGSLYTYLLYKNSKEALKVLLDNPELMMEAKHLIEANKGAVSEALNGYAGVIYNTDEIVSFLKAYAKKSPPGLKLLANIIRWEMLTSERQGELFLGFRLK